MSKSTLRRRTAVLAVSALAAGVLSFTAVPAANATHPLAGTANGNPAALSTPGNHLFVATASNSTAAAVLATGTQSGTSALSKGLLSKDTSSGTAQTATILAGGALSLYANVASAVTFSATGGTFSSVNVITTGTSGSAPTPVTATYNSSNSKSWLPIARIDTASPITNIATGVAAIWTAPTTAGSYTVSMSSGFVLQSNGTTYSEPSTDNGDSPTLVGNIVVTVVATSAGGSYSPIYSACRTAVNTTSNYNALSTSNAAVDSTGTVKNGDAWSIDFDLNDAYAADLAAGNIVVTATNGALVNLGTAGTTPVAGTASTVVSAGSPSGTGLSGAGRTVRVDQPTAGAPLTTTVTISFNGTTVCTKTVTIRGKVAKITVANVGTQDLSTSGGNVQWMYQEIGLSSAGLFTVLATDSAGNIVATDGIGTWAADSATLNTVVQAATFPTQATSSSSTSTSRFTLGSFQCGAIAGSANLRVQFTTTATGETIKSDPFVARCADNPDTYTVSLDKAAYKQGDIATATVQFLDSKGNKANSVTAVGANSWILPYFTGVTFTMADGASSTAVTKADGSVAYTFTVGTTTAVVNGSYAGVVTYSVPANGVKSTPTYSLSTGGDTTTNADVLKSIVALIASINKQIRALQKLILRR